MPSGGLGARAEQLSLIKGMSHELLTQEEMPDWFAAAEHEAPADPWHRANLREMRRLWDHSAALDRRLVEELSEAATACFAAWEVARVDGKFAVFEPVQSRVLTLVREIASIKGESLGLAPYDALLDQYEPEMSSLAIDSIFGPLREQLPALLDEIIARQSRRPKTLPLQGPFPVSKQKALGMRLMTTIGFNFEHGRLDECTHPFCGGVPEDLRVTTRYAEDRFLKGLMAIAHETGHAMYESQLPRDWRRQPVGAARGAALHESQALLLEMQVFRSPEFIGYFAPIVAREFGGEGEAWSEANLLRHYDRVSRGRIRVDADEVSYPLHVILRYEIEKMLIVGSLQYRDIPDAWNERMERLVGVQPSSLLDGCLQDIHWTEGIFGYFPSYTLGAIAASQFISSANAAMPSLKDELRQGRLSGLMSWLSENVHSRASSVATDAIIREATGTPLDSGHFLNHLRSRYLAD